MKKLVYPLSLAMCGMLFAQKMPAQQPSSQSGNNTQNSSTAAQPRSRSTRAQVQSQRARRSEEASDLLDAANEARTAVEWQNRQDALEHINHALENAQTLSRNANNNGFVTLYGELDRYSVLGPIISQRHNTPQDTDAANQRQPSQRTREGTAVREVEGQYTNVGLDVKAAKDHLQAAKQALNQSEWRRADVALAAVQSGVVVTSVAADLPLLRARENMMLARNAAQNGDIREARAALTSTSRALKEYASGSGRHASEARMLQTQIDKYNQTLGQDDSGALAKIDSWWDQMAGWMTATNQPKQG